MLRKIDINVGILLYNDLDHQSSHEDLKVAFSIAIDLIHPLLTNPDHARYMIPGLSMLEVPPETSAWNWLEGIVILHEVPLACLQDLCFEWGSGISVVTSGCIQVGTPGAAVCRFEKVKNQKSRVAKGMVRKNSVRVRMTLHRSKIRDLLRMCSFSPYDSLIGNKRIDLAVALRSYVCGMSGFFLYVPQAKPRAGVIENAARILAVASEIDLAKKRELMAIAQEVIVSSKCSGAELRRAVTAEASKIKRIPVAELFTPEVFAAPVTGMVREFNYPIHPLVAAMCNANDGDCVVG